VNTTCVTREYYLRHSWILLASLVTTTCVTREYYLRHSWILLASLVNTTCVTREYYLRHSWILLASLVNTTLRLYFFAKKFRSFVSHAEDPDEDASNTKSSIKTNGCSCSPQQCRPGRLRCDCLCNSCRLCKGAVTAQTFVWVQHQRWIVVI